MGDKCLRLASPGKCMGPCVWTNTAAHCDRQLFGLISAARPKALTMDMLDQADRVVTMGCGVEGVCPASFVETEDWQLEDPKGRPIEEVRRIRDEIMDRVQGLVQKY